MSRSSYLLRLQQIDSQRDIHLDRLAELSQLLENDQNVMQSLSKLEDAQLASEKVRRAYRLVQEEFDSVEEKRRASELRLYGGTVKNPKELQDLTNEVAALGRRLQILEDRQLETMLIQDDADEAEASARSEYVGIESAWKASQRVLASEQLEHQSEVARLDGEREVVLEPINLEHRQTYEKLRDSKGRIAVVTLDDGVCSSCGMTPSESRVQQARVGVQIVKCGNCGRIICMV